ncbi:MAG: glycosyltransferase [Methanobrevibacter sp.]
MVKVSVIIPVFNTENYLKECLNSIINQTLEDIEIICINDGSTDNSLEILNEYANKDSRIKVYSEKNKGQGAARNLGLKYVNGKYIYFMDSDDILKDTALEETYTLCEEKSLDFIIFKLTSYNENAKKKYNEDYYEMSLLEKFKGKIFNYKDLDDLIFEIPVSPVNKLINAEFFKNLNIKFPEGLIFEDNPIFWDVLFNAKRIYIYDKYLYIRRRHTDSSTGNTNNKHLIDTIKINNLVLEKFIKYNLFKTYKNNLYNKKINLVYLRFTKINKIYKNLFFNEMKKDFTNMLNDYRFNDIIEHLNFRNKYIFENIIFSNSQNELNEKIKINDLISTYNTARIDIKNLGNEINYIEFIEKDNLDIKEPNWFKDKKGIGYVIESSQNSLDLKFKCIGDGKINIKLKGPDKRDKNNNRFPIYIDYTKFIVNNKNIINKNKLIYHDKPYIYKKNVKNGETIKLHVEWLPFNRNSLFINEKEILKEKINEIENNQNKLEKENNKIKQENNKLNKKNTEIKEKYNNLEKKYNEILLSNSWKITKPIRNVKKKLKNLNNKNL